MPNNQTEPNFANAHLNRKNGKGTGDEVKKKEKKTSYLLLYPQIHKFIAPSSVLSALCCETQDPS